MCEKLIELISQIQYMGGLESRLAEHLIANGVTIPVRCKDCKHRMYSDFDGCYVCHHGGFNAINPDHFCSYGERRTDDRETG